jgi:hypothetical protein
MRLRKQRDDMQKSIHKASTARQHKRPPPLVRKGTARASALEMLSSFMQMSVVILHEQLEATKSEAVTDEDGKTTEIEVPDLPARRSAARYVMDKIAAAEGTYIPEGIDLEIDSETVLETGNKIIELVLQGSLSIEAGAKVFGLLQQQAQLHGLNELEELKAMVSRMNGDSSKVINGVPGGQQNPAWMRLQAGAPKQ